MQQNKQEVLMSAFRYAIGRCTYIVSIMAEVLIYEHKNKGLEPNTVAVILRDIQEARERDALGDACDIKEWEKVEEVLSGGISNK